MEALAAVSSIAGLLSLAGQCASGAQNLLTLYRDIATASETVYAFVRDINGLLRTLEDVRVLLEKIKQQAPPVADDVCLTSLKLQLEDCDHDIGLWLRTAQATKPTGGKGTRAWFRKFWVAMDRQSTNNLRADIQKRRTEIAVALSTLGRSLDLRLASIAESVNNHARETHATTHALVNSSADANEALLRLETTSISVSDEIGSMKSLLSSINSRSQSEAERSPSPTTHWNKGWQCDQWQVLDDLFSPIETLKDGTEVRRCSFCGLTFLEPPSMDVREQHCKVTHTLAACINKAALYLDEDLFHDHLVKAHNARLGTWTQTLQKVCCVHNKSRIPAKDLVSTDDEARAECADSIQECDMWDEVPPETAGEAFVTSLWDSNLLGEWYSERDRVNRWMLHMLGAEAKNAEALQTIYRENTKTCLTFLASCKVDSSSSTGLLTKLQ